MTHTFLMTINGITPKIEIEAQINMETGEFDITNTPEISNTKYLDCITEFMHVLFKVKRACGDIETIEITKIP